MNLQGGDKWGSMGPRHTSHRGAPGAMLSLIITTQEVVFPFQFVPAGSIERRRLVSRKRAWADRKWYPRSFRPVSMESIPELRRPGPCQWYLRLFSPLPHPQAIGALDIPPTGSMIFP